MAGTACAILSANIETNCDAKPVGGVEQKITLINIGDWQKATIVRDSTNKRIINSITLASPAVGYAFIVFRRGHKPRFTNKDSDYGTYYLHEVVTSIQVWNNAIKAQLPALSDNYYVVIVENVQKTGDAVFEVYGEQNGLRVQDGAIRDLGANEGVYSCTFANDSNMYEPNPPSSIVAGIGSPIVFNYATTKTAVDALSTP